MKNITFINAGAGSGKTYRLTKELYEAIKSGECAANEVMLTTFTKKAAAEIKIKAREKLLDKALFVEANNLQNAYIGTVHSVGQQIIQKFWHYIGFPKDIRIIDQDDVDFYFNQAIANIPTEKELILLNELNYRFNLQADRFYDSKRWQKDLIRIIEEARTNNIIDFTESKKDSIAYAKTILNTNASITIDYVFFSNLIDKIIKLGENLPDKNNKGRKDTAKGLHQINKSNIQYSQLKKIKEVVYAFEGDGVTLQEIDKTKKELEAFQRSKNLFDDINNYNKLLFELAEKSINKYIEYKQEIGLIDYSDMENGFLRLLDIKEVQEEIRNTIKLVMVDEFQDSSPIQLDIFIKLSNIVNRSIWVGDPKQSIYGFRGTDPALIDAIINKFEGNNTQALFTSELKYSWRSRPDIVNLVNNIFVPALKDQVKKENIKLESVRTNKGFERKALHHFNLVEWKEDKKKETMVKDVTKPAYNKAIAKSIVKLLKEEWIVSDKDKSEPNQEHPENEIIVNRKMKASDIAILCKSNDAITEISKELSNYGVKFSTESKTLNETVEFYLIKALVKLVISEQNTLAKAEVKLLSDDECVLASVIDDRLKYLDNLPKYPKYNSEEFDNNESLKEKYLVEIKEYKQKLNAWGKNNLLINGITTIISELKELPVPQLIEHVVNRLNIYDVISKFDNTEQRYSNIQKIIQYAYKYDERCINMNLGASLIGFLNYLSLQDELTEAKSDNEDAVNILTYHGSKGLEWPIVILAELHSSVHWAFIARNIFKIFIQNTKGIDIENILKDRSIISLPWPFGTLNTKPSSDLENHIQSTPEYATAKINHNNELKRLMYVGMTRPRDYMITTGLSGKKKVSDNTQVYPWLDIVNHHGDWKFENYADIDTCISDIFDRDVNFQVQKLDLNDDEKIRKEELNQYFAGKEINIERKSEPYFISPSKVKANDTVNVSVYANIQNRISTGSSAEDKMNVLGNCLHDILYLHIGNILNENTNNSKIDCQNIIDNHNMTNIILDVEEVLSSINKLHEYLQKEFNPIEWHRELPLEVLIDGQLYKGEADLLLETNDGYILIDYKSYPGSIERVLDASSKDPDKSNYAGNYSGQLNTYVKMIEKITGKKVINKLIYYTILGQLVELK